MTGRTPVGVHLPLDKGLRGAVDYAASLKLDCAQLFAGNPRSFVPCAWTAEAMAQFRELAAAQGLAPLVIHARYLCNLASPDPELQQLTRDSLLDSLRVADAIGAGCVVVHSGAHLGEGPEAGIQRAQDCARAVLADYGGPARLLLENGAGSGTGLGADLSELARLGEGLEADRVGFCLDTAHLHSAGYNFMDAKGLARLDKQVKRELGLARLALLHVNDNSRELGSGWDRHEQLGAGRIGQGGFEALFGLEWPRVLPCILETPKSPASADRRNLNWLRRLLAGKAPGRPVKPARKEVST